MDYKKLETEINSALNFTLTDVNMNALLSVIKKEQMDTVRIKAHGKNGNENAFKEAAIPLIKYLCENHHPHVTVIVTPTNAELLEGLKTTGNIDQFLRD